MSSHSSDVSVGPDHPDETCSCGTYSSGWDRSSTSDYWDSSSEYEEEDYRHHHYTYQTTQPKKTGKPTLSEIEYKCELVVLPNPYHKLNSVKPPSVKDEEEPEEKQEEKEEDKTETVPVANPWKVGNSPPQYTEDPWKFLEEMNKPAEKERTYSREHKRERDDRRKTISRPIDNSNTNKLCKYKEECRMNKNNQCGMVHALSAWKPRVCRFNHNCKRKTMCGYYHSNMSLADYLRIMIQTPDSIYAKNSALYEKYL